MNISSFTFRSLSVNSSMAHVTFSEPSTPSPTPTPSSPPGAPPRIRRPSFYYTGSVPATPQPNGLGCYSCGMKFGESSDLVTLFNRTGSRAGDTAIPDVRICHMCLCEYAPPSCTHDVSSWGYTGEGVACVTCYPVMVFDG